MSTYDWSKFSKKININSSVETIYNAWTIPALLERWFLRKAIFITENNIARQDATNIQRGDRYTWNWYGYDDIIVEKGEVLFANDKNKLQFSFVEGATVTVHIGEADGETIVMLTQEGMPTDENGKVRYHMECLAGWTFFLANLKSYLEGGIDLRNKNNDLTNMVNS